MNENICKDSKEERKGRPEIIKEGKKERKERKVVRREQLGRYCSQLGKERLKGWKNGGGEDKTKQEKGRKMEERGRRKEGRKE